MKNEKILTALEKVDEKFIIASSPENTKKSKNRKRNAWITWGTMAACLCLAAGGAVLESKTGFTKEEGSGYVVSEDGITIPKIEVALATKDAEKADMLAFFIYEGRCYVHYEFLYDEMDIVGKYLGTATGLINEWTPKEGYVDFAGSICGDFYSVNGYDPEFMLCTKDGNGVVSIYICNNGITLNYGKELYEDRLHLSENMTGIQYESRASWYYSMGELYELDVTEAYIQNFIRQLSTEKFLLCQDVEEQEEWNYMVDSEIYHLYFIMNNGTKIHLRLHENGYVRFQGLTDLCVKIPEECYNSLINMFAQKSGTPVEKVQDGK